MGSFTLDYGARSIARRHHRGDMGARDRAGINNDRLLDNEGRLLLAH
jgi:hypothetical protein